MRKRRLTMGAAIDECVSESTEAWYREHGGYRSREEAFTNDWRMLSATVERQAGGFLVVHVGIVTRQRKTTISDMYRYQRSGELGYVRNEPSKALG